MNIENLIEDKVHKKGACGGIHALLIRMKT